MPYLSHIGLSGLVGVPCLGEAPCEPKGHGSHRVHTTIPPKRNPMSILSVALLSLVLKFAHERVYAPKWPLV